VFITNGGMALEYNKVNKKIAEKRRNSYLSIMTYIRTKLIFALEEHPCCSTRQTE